MKNWLKKFAQRRHDKRHAALRPSGYKCCSRRLAIEQYEERLVLSGSTIDGSAGVVISVVDSGISALPTLSSPNANLFQNSANDFLAESSNGLPPLGRDEVGEIYMPASSISINFFRYFIQPSWDSSWTTDSGPQLLESLNALRYGVAYTAIGIEPETSFTIPVLPIGVQAIPESPVNIQEITPAIASDTQESGTTTQIVDASVFVAPESSPPIASRFLSSAPAPTFLNAFFSANNGSPTDDSNGGPEVNGVAVTGANGAVGMPDERPLANVLTPSSSGSISFFDPFEHQLANTWYLSNIDQVKNDRGTPRVSDAIRGADVEEFVNSLREYAYNVPVAAHLPYLGGAAGFTVSGDQAEPDVSFNNSTSNPFILPRDFDGGITSHQIVNGGSTPVAIVDSSAPAYDASIWNPFYSIGNDLPAGGADEEPERDVISAAKINQSAAIPEEGPLAHRYDISGRLFVPALASQSVQRNDSLSEGGAFEITAVVEGTQKAYETQLTSVIASNLDRDGELPVPLAPQSKPVVAELARAVAFEIAEQQETDEPTEVQQALLVSPAEPIGEINQAAVQPRATLADKAILEISTKAAGASTFELNGFESSDDKLQRIDEEHQAAHTNIFSKWPVLATAVASYLLIERNSQSTDVQSVQTPPRRSRTRSIQ